MSKDQENKQSENGGKVDVNEEKGLQPAENPPEMPDVKPPKSENENS